MRTAGIHGTIRAAAMVLAAALVVACGRDAAVGGAVRDGIEFGVWMPDERGDLRFEATLEVPYVADQAFGWRVRGAPPDRPVQWVEKLELSSAPDSWEGMAESPNVQISGDGRTATTFGTSLPGDEFIGNVWFLSPGDPMGECSIRVEFEDGREATFRFRIVAPGDGRAPASAGEIV